jgi:hypothetical protein
MMYLPWYYTMASLCVRSIFSIPMTEFKRQA